MNNRFFNICLTSIALSVPTAHAAWYEVTGQTTVLKSDEQARVRALEDAVFQALKFSGADIAGLSSIKPFLATNRENYLFSGDEVRQIQVINQRKKNGVMEITARIDIYPTAKACHKNQYRKGLLLGRFDLVSPQQASLGGIYQFGDDFSVILKRQFETQSQSFVVQGISDISVNPAFPEMMTMIADDNDAQYLLSGTISDMSATIEKKTLGKDKTNRQLAMTIDVIDGKTGEVVYQNNYRDIADWPFERHSKLDTKTARFWTSPYGEMAQRISRNILLDMESSLSCRATTPEVVSIDNQKGQINAGRVHGVKYGDQLQLWHNATFADRFGITRSQLRKSQMKLTVTRVYENSADVSVSPVDLAPSIQIGDMVTKQFN